MREVAEAVLLSDELKTVRGTTEQKLQKGLENSTSWQRHLGWWHLLWLSLSSN